MRKLVKADEFLAKVAIHDANNTGVRDPTFEEMVNHQIEMAEKELEKASEELQKGQTRQSNYEIK